MTTTTVQLTSLRAPVKPFYFNTSAHLVRITTQKANTLAELLGREHVKENFLMTTNVRRLVVAAPHLSFRLTCIVPPQQRRRFEL